MNRIAIHQGRICEALGSMKVGSSFTSWPNVRYLKMTERRLFRFNFISPIMLDIASRAFRNISQLEFLYQVPLTIALTTRPAHNNLPGLNISKTLD